MVRANEDANYEANFELQNVHYALIKRSSLDSLAFFHFFFRRVTVNIGVFRR